MELTTREKFAHHRQSQHRHRLQKASDAGVCDRDQGVFDDALFAMPYRAAYKEGWYARDRQLFAELLNYAAA